VYVYCTTLRVLALTTPPTALESLDAGLTPNWRRQTRQSRFERAFLYISSLKVSVGVATRFERSCRISLTRTLPLSFFTSPSSADCACARPKQVWFGTYQRWKVFWIFPHDLTSASGFTTAQSVAHSPSYSLDTGDWTVAATSWPLTTTYCRG
jgi:hypothetical protein